MNRFQPALRRIRRTLLTSVAYPVADRLFDPSYLPILRQLRDLERLPPEQVFAHQWGRLLDLIDHAYRTTTYYHTLLDRAGLRPDKLTPALFQEIPVLTKAIVRREFPSGLTSSEAASGRLVMRSTSGTTQEALRLYKDAATRPFDRATHVWLNSWMGLRRGDRMVHAMHYGRASSARDRAWHALTGARYLPPEVTLSRDGAAIAALLDRWQPDALFGTPPFLEAAAKALVAAGRRPARPPKVVFYHSEMLEPGGQAVMREAFPGAALVSRYATVEFGSWVAQTCPADAAAGRPPEHNLHVNNLRYYAEVLQSDGTPADPGEEGRLVITDLWNRAMPLIRYDIGDLASLASGPCPCGRGLQRLGSLSGRVTGTVKLPAGGELTGVVLFPPTKPYWSRWWEAQFEQVALDRLVLSIVPREGQMGPADLAALERSLKAVLPEGPDVTVRLVDSIPFEPSGKRPFLKILTPSSN